MARVRTSVSLGTVAVVVLGAVSLGIGSVTMPSPSTLGGPVVLSARPDLERPQIAAPEGTTGPGTVRIEAAAVGPVEVRAPTPIRAETDRSATSGTGSHRDTGTTLQPTTTGTDAVRAPTGPAGQSADPPVDGTVSTSEPAPAEPTHTPSVISRGSELRGAADTSIATLTSETSTPEGTRTHDPT